MVGRVGRAYEVNAEDFPPAGIRTGVDTYATMETTNGTLRSGSFTNGSLRHGARPNSSLYLPKKPKKRKCCGNLTKLEIFLFVTSLLLLGALLGTLACWFVITRGFQFFSMGPIYTEEEGDMRVVFWNENSSSTPAPPPPVCGTKGCGQIAGLFLENMDDSVDPCQDFYQFACGNYPIYNILSGNRFMRNTIKDANVRLFKQLKSYLDKEIEPDEPPWSKLPKTFYKKCNDVDTITKSGVADLLNWLDEMGGFPILDGPDWVPESEEKWEAVLGKFQRKTGRQNVLIELAIQRDEKNSTKYRICLDQPGLGMPGGYFRSSGPIKLYRKFMMDTIKALGGNGSWIEKDIDDIVKLETQIASKLAGENSRRQQDRLYNANPIFKLQEDYPDMDLHSYLNAAFDRDLPVEEIVIIREIGFLKSLQNIMKNVSPRLIQNYLMWLTVEFYAAYLPTDFANLMYKMHSDLSGIKLREYEERWVECIQRTGLLLPLPVGAIYVHNFFHHETALAQVHDMLGELKQATVEMLKGLEWMDEKTRTRAMAKAYLLDYKTGYPDFYHNETIMKTKWSDIQLEPSESALRMAVTLTERQWKDDTAKITKTPDKGDWGHMCPAQVEAFYSPSSHQMIFPAGMMQFPFVTEGAPNYVTFALIGNVIGHEIFHGYDDMGAQYNKYGMLENWWDKTTKELFNNKTECLKNQYGNVFVKEANSTLNGEVTLGENIADNAGIKAAYHAYKLWESRREGPELSLPGFTNYTNDQMFFISFANTWCQMIRPEVYQRQIMGDFHSPNPYRAMIPLSNFEKFADTFECPRGSPMNPMKQCVVW